MVNCNWNYGKARHLETGDSDTHHDSDRHRNEPGSGELHVGCPSRGCVTIDFLDADDADDADYFLII